MLDQNNVLVESPDTSGAEKFALLFEFDGDEKAICHVLYNCSTSRLSIESETKEDTTALFLPRSVEIGISVGDLDLLTIGMVLDMWTEKANDDVKYQRVAD